MDQIPLSFDILINSMNVCILEKTLCFDDAP